MLLLIFATSSCKMSETKIECDKQTIIQKCLNYLSANDPKFKTATIIYSNTLNSKIPLLWNGLPVFFEKNDLKDIRKLVDRGKLYFIIDKIGCDKEKTKIDIICINENLLYQFELHQTKDGKEVLKVVQEIDDVLPFR
jgi:hypothetical protein